MNASFTWASFSIAPSDTRLHGVFSGRHGDRRSGGENAELILKEPLIPGFGLAAISGAQTRVRDGHPGDQASGPRRRDGRAGKGLRGDRLLAG